MNWIVGNGRQMVADKSLVAYAEANPRYATTVAWITTIPEWPEILEAWESGKVNQAQICDWLVEHRGYEKAVVTRARVAYLSKVHPRRHRV